MKKFTPLFILLLLACVPLLAQQRIQESVTLKWNESPIIHQVSANYPTEIWEFDNAHYSHDNPSIPIYMYAFDLPRYGTIDARISNTVFEAIPINSSRSKGIISDKIAISSSVEKNRSQYVGRVVIAPIRQVAKGRYEKLVKFDLTINVRPQAAPNFRGPTNTSTSALADGDIYKIAINNTGIHKLSFDFLKNELGINNLENINPATIQVYGNYGGPLAELVSSPRVDDLAQQPIEIVDGNDGSFDSGDFILFYAEAADAWAFNEADSSFFYKKNIYDTRNYFFIKINGQQGLRISSQASIDNTNYTSNSFNDRIRYEEDRVNLLHDYSLGQGSGQDWFGDLFEVTRTRTYDNFTFPNILSDQDATLKVAFTGRSEANSRIRATVDGQTFDGTVINSVRTGEPESTHAKAAYIDSNFKPSSDNLPVTIDYLDNGTASKGWLDYIELQVKRQLSMTSAQFSFRDLNSMNYTATNFLLDNANPNTVIWDISNPIAPIRQEADFNNNQLSFGAATSNLKEFIAFNKNENLLQAEAIGKIANQNIHNIDDVDMVIIYPSDFAASAEQLAEHRRQFSQLKVASVLISDIYNEFASGRQDPTAIRDFAKMIHDRTDRFKYLLLFGDGSFDNRGLYTFNTPSNFIPVYETIQSLNPISAFPSDDYFALLSEGEGTPTLQGQLDLAVGRIPVKTAAEAQAAVNKILRYDNNPNMLGDWRNKLLFVADDEDGNLHVRDADGIAETVANTYNDFNVNKIYLDAFQQVSTPGGEKYPAVTEAFNAALFQGLFVVNYLGHGGAKGWTQERILSHQDIDTWNNSTQLPLFVTATCSFSGYDDPAFVTAGERTFLNPQGGSIGLFTTVRAVFSNSNKFLTAAVFRNIFEKQNGVYPTIGEILRNAKNEDTGASISNSRKFTLIGDPALKLAIPEYGVSTTHINGVAIDSTVVDTLNALQRVTIQGMITDKNGDLISDFNGEVFPTIYDKSIVRTTLGQDDRSYPFDFNLQKNILFKGAATVNNGTFAFSFVVPKDINYDFGPGKISYYAKDDQQRDARGHYEKFIVGGTDPNVADDTEGPVIEVFMNNEDFVFGGITDENPVLYLTLSDNNGINVAGSSVGHDLTAILDEDTQNGYRLNDFYEAALDDYTKGTVRFPLFDMEAGRHTIKVKAWDVANNSTEGYTEFIVASSEQAALEHVLNYPNPFTTTTNFQFEHNLTDQLVNVQVRIFTVAGRLVKTIDQQLLSDGYRVTDLTWNGTDDYGAQLARGVYLYKIKVSAADDAIGSRAVESEFEKLVILK